MHKQIKIKFKINRISRIRFCYVIREKLNAFHSLFFRTFLYKLNTCVSTFLYIYFITCHLSWHKQQITNENITVESRKITLKRGQHFFFFFSPRWKFRVEDSTITAAEEESISRGIFRAGRQRRRLKSMDAIKSRTETALFCADRTEIREVRNIKNRWGTAALVDCLFVRTS